MDMVEEVDTAVEEPPDPNVVEKDPTGRYSRYKGVIGEGSSKKVYKAFDEENGIEVAWSCVSIQDVSENSSNFKRLCSELQLLKSLKHKNIIKFITAWEDKKQKKVNIITELFTSGNLRRYRLDHPRVNIKALKNWARQILEGLNYLHNHDPPIIHRDIKCDNIFVNGHSGKVKIGDLGLATLILGEDAHSFVGTFEFMAPEVFDGDYNELADIYSFGMCMLEMVTCEFPYKECANQAHIFKHVTSGIKPLSLNKVKDPEAKLFIEKCLVPAAERMSAAELLRDPFLQVNGLTENSELSLGKSAPLLVVPANIGCSRHETEIEILEARMKDENSASLKVRFAKRIIDFTFYLASDTSFLVASEMIHELELDDQHVMLLAELIDSSLTLLVPNWKPSEALSGTGPPESPTSNSQMSGEREVIPVVSIGNLFETLSLLDSPSPTETSLQLIEESPDYMQLKRHVSHAGFEFRDSAMTSSSLSLIFPSMLRGTTVHDLSADMCLILDILNKTGIGWEHEFKDFVQQSNEGDIMRSPETSIAKIGFHMRHH